MSTIGFFGLLVAFAACIISVVCLFASQFFAARVKKLSAGSAEVAKVRERSGMFSWGGRLAVILCAAALTVSCGVLVVCFFTGNVSIDYVLKNRSSATGSLAWLYKLSGLWAGREGSLLFWTWLISV